MVCVVFHAFLLWKTYCRRGTQPPPRERPLWPNFFNIKPVERTQTSPNSGSTVMGIDGIRFQGGGSSFLMKQAGLFS